MPRLAEIGLDTVQSHTHQVYFCRILLTFKSHPDRRPDPQSVFNHLQFTYFVNVARYLEKRISIASVRLL